MTKTLRLMWDKAISLSVLSERYLMQNPQLVGHDKWRRIPRNRFAPRTLVVRAIGGCVSLRTIPAQNPNKLVNFCVRPGRHDLEAKPFAAWYDVGSPSLNEFSHVADADLIDAKLVFTHSLTSLKVASRILFDLGAELLPSSVHPK
jgi:hypothetical protein